MSAFAFSFQALLGCLLQQPAGIPSIKDLKGPRQHSSREPLRSLAAICASPLEPRGRRRRDCRAATRSWHYRHLYASMIRQGWTHITVGGGWVLPATSPPAMGVSGPRAESGPGAVKWAWLRLGLAGRGSRRPNGLPPSWTIAEAVGERRKRRISEPLRSCARILVLRIPLV